MPAIEIYTKFTCGYCARAKALLSSKGARFTEYDITMGGPRAAEMRERSGGVTVPQIFIDDLSIGGCDDLYALERAGKLDRLLERG